MVREDNTSAPNGVCFKLSSKKPPQQTDGSKGPGFVLVVRKMPWSSCFDHCGFTAESWGCSTEETPSPSPGLSHVWEAAEETEESLSHFRFPHLKTRLIWAEVLSLSTGGPTDTPRGGQGMSKRTLSLPPCKYLTPHLMTGSRTPLTLKLPQQHRFSLRVSLLPSSCWLKAAVSDSLHRYAVGLFAVPLSCSVCTSHICGGPRCWQAAPSLRSSGRCTLIPDCCSHFMQCKVFSSPPAPFAKLDESDATPPPATNDSWKTSKVTHLVTILSGEGGWLEKERFGENSKQMPRQVANWLFSPTLGCPSVLIFKLSTIPHSSNIRVTYRILKW